MPEVRPLVSVGGPSEQVTTIAFADTASAKYACEHWHYSGTLPIGKTVKVGLWEDDRFAGIVIFSTGVGNLQAIGFKYGLDREQTCELARVALRDHTMPVSQLVAAALRLLRSTNPKLMLVVSYADPEAGHLGSIYQAMNWTYTGPSAMLWEKRIDGKWRHNRTIQGATNANPHGKTQFGRKPGQVLTKEEIDAAPTRFRSSKFRYLYAFDKKMRRTISKEALPYPTSDDLAAQVSEARRRSTRPEGRVRSSGAARPQGKS